MEKKTGFGKQVVLEFIDFLRFKVENDSLSLEEADGVAKLLHELRHLIDSIAFDSGIHLYGEPVAYMTGDTGMALADIVCKLGCRDCRE